MISVVGIVNSINLTWTTVLTIPGINWRQLDRKTPPQWIVPCHGNWGGGMGV